MPATDRKQPTTAELVEHIANRYGDVALSSTPREFVVLKPGEDETSMMEKHAMVDAARQNILGGPAAGVPFNANSTFPEARPGTEKKLAVLSAMSAVTSPDDAHSSTSLPSGVVTVAPDDAKVILPKGNEETATAVVVLHELGHANLAQLDKTDDGYLNSSFDEKTATFVSAWDREMPENVLNAVRVVMNKHKIVPEPSEGIKFQGGFGAYVEAVFRVNQSSLHQAVAQLHGIVHEAYADSFAILSIAAKDGAVKGSELAESVRGFRAQEAAGVTGVDTHDTTRGLAWLGKYLKSEQGDRLLATLNANGPDSPASTELVHQTALKFATLNVSKYAKDHGASPEQSELISGWVTSTYNANEATLNSRVENQSGSTPAQKPEVYSFDKETISALGGSKPDATAAKPAAEAPQREMAMYRHR